jgi:hypothetical protein
MLKILSFAGQNKLGQKLVKCACDCGKTVVAVAANIRLGRTKSCGCLHARLAPIHGFKPGWRGILPPGAVARNQILKNYRRRAKVKAMAFALSDDQFQHLISQPCYYCGCGPSSCLRVRRLGRLKVDAVTYNGLDRTDSSKGYTLENSVPCCKTCNYAKSSMGVSEFKAWVKRVVQHLGL